LPEQDLKIVREELTHLSLCGIGLDDCVIEVPGYLNRPSEEPVGRNLAKHDEVSIRVARL
jgi:hypothetical protein